MQQSPLQRLYKTKIALVSFVTTVVGATIMVAAGWPSWQAIASLLGGAVFTVGLVLNGFQYVGNEDAEQLAVERTNTAVAAAAPAFVASVIDAMANTPEEILRVAAPEVLDRVIENCLARQLNDRALAADIYRDLKAQALRSDERQYDVRVAVSLTPWEHGPASGDGSMFAATIRWEYRVTPSSNLMRFACVSNLDEHRELLQDATYTLAWYFQEIGQYDGASRDVFELLQCSVDGKERPIRRSTRRGGQFYTVVLADPHDSESQEVVISYTYRVLVQRNSHLLYLRVAQPSKGLSVQLGYGGCSIRHVNVLEYITSARTPRIVEIPPSDPAPSVEVGFDGWVLPKGGVAFVWVLDDELASHPDGARSGRQEPVVSRSPVRSVRTRHS